MLSSLIRPGGPKGWVPRPAYRKDAGLTLNTATALNERCQQLAAYTSDARRLEGATRRPPCATLLAALDVHPRVAMRILRHSKINVTMEIYTEAPSEATVEALRKLSEQLSA